jgi:phosphohistidine phosphatase
MRLLVIRHAIAEEDAGAGKDDSARQLTKGGRIKMRAAAAGLVKLVESIDVLASSPLMRAVETAKIVAEVYAKKGAGENAGTLKVAQVAALEPAKPVNALLHWLQGQQADATIAIVGHEPHLGTVISWLLSGEQRSFVKPRKGSACLLEFERDVKAGSATLQWMLKPSQLRKLE